MFCKEGALKNSQNLPENTCAGVFFNKVVVTPTQGLSWEFCEIFKTTYFVEHMRATASRFSYYYSFFP